MIEAFVGVWGEIMSFIVTIFTNMSQVFWDTTANDGAGGLTFVGIMAIIMAGVALVLLVFNLIRSFFPLRG